MARIAFTRMWQLIHDNYGTFFGKYRNIFPGEILAAIFWEETLFENRTQLKGGPAVGFGQVERPNIREINRRFGTTFDLSGSDVLSNEAQSVQIAGLLLAWLYEDQLSKIKQGKQILPMARRATLLNYAGYPMNQDKIPKWESCEAALLQLKLGPAPLTIDSGLAPKIKAALRLARGCDDAEFQPTFP
jgi:hypothetical protein